FKLQFLLFFDFLLNFSVEIVCAIGTHLVPDKHGLYDVVQILFGGLSVLLVKREEDER
ncbi:Serine/threonine protein phosphatase, partial [Dysosmobacter welbionis]